MRTRAGLTLVRKFVIGAALASAEKHNNISNMEVQQVIIMYIQDLLVGISNIIDIFEPEAISIGGGFAYYKDILYNKLLEEFYNRKYVFNKNSLPEIKLASLGNDAGIIGAVIN